MPYDKKIQLQKKNPDSELWEDWGIARHAKVNRSTSKEVFVGGAERSEQGMRFEFRWTNTLAEIRLNTQLFRLVYRDGIYNITGYDDYMEQHQTVVLEAMSYARNS